MHYGVAISFLLFVIFIKRLSSSLLIVEKMLFYLKILFNIKTRLCNKDI